MILSDDLDEDVLADETVSFSLDGANYEVNPSKQHAQELQSALSQYVQATRKVGRA